MHIATCSYNKLSSLPTSGYNLNVFLLWGWMHSFRLSNSWKLHDYCLLSQINSRSAFPLYFENIYCACAWFHVIKLSIGPKVKVWQGGGLRTLCFDKHSRSPESCKELNTFVIDLVIKPLAPRTKWHQRRSFYSFFYPSPSRRRIYSAILNPVASPSHTHRVPQYIKVSK